MTWKRAARLAWIAPALAAAFGAAFLVAMPAGEAEGVEALFLLTFVAYASVGWLIVSAHPRHPVGWLFAFTGVAFSAQEVLYAYASGPSRPGATAASWLSTWSTEPSTVVILLILLLFPTGRFASRRWRAVGLAGVAAAAALALVLAFRPGPMSGPAGIANPLGVESAGSVLRPLASAGIALFAMFVVAGVAGAIARFRAARGVERRQLKWMALAAAALSGMLGLQALLLLAVDTDRGIWDAVTSVIYALAVMTFPVAAAVAILRERLYDIDVVIRRTLVYGALTATLAAGYLGGVLVSQALIGAESDLAIAGSTLAMAALFRPARARIQAAVDRRFYRRRYDAARTLEAFSARLRDELDIEALGADLRGAARETVQPAHVSLWMRGGSR